MFNEQMVCMPDAQNDYPHHPAIPQGHFAQFRVPAAGIPASGGSKQVCVKLRDKSGSHLLHQETKEVRRP